GAEVLAHGTVEAFGGFLRADALSALIVGLTAFVALVCGIYAVGYLREERQADRINDLLLHRYYVITPIFVGTMMAVPLVNNLGLLWVAIESTTLASVLLVRFYNHKSSLEAAWQYIIIGSAGIALALFGTVLTYFAAVPVVGEHAENGFNWSVLIEVADKCHPAAMRLGFVMVLVGYGTKAGLAPMHTWKPDAYAEAPVPSAALLGAAFVNCAIYGIMRFYALAAKCLGHDYTGNLLVIFGVASILVAVPFVLVQRNFRRLLAYSSIDHAGIMVAALGFGGKLGALGAVLHMVFHAVAKPLMFFCAGNVQQHYGSPYFRKVTGVIHTRPWTGALFLMATLAVTGAPPFSLFQSEFTALSAALAADRGWAAGLFVGGIVTIFAGFLVHMSKLSLGRPSHAAAPGGECPWKLGAMVLVAVPVVVMGLVLPAPLYELVHRAAVMIGGMS
ncbi:MAG: hydrogenase 4 subunit F, partial [Verrucomicrobia bacterium]|nr:hydrogenase 4 subunit F [Verrucomicrobiota bacterium]